MSFVVRKFEDLKEYYRTLPPETRVLFMVKGKVVRIQCGKLAWEGELTKDIKKWLKEVNALELVEVVPPEEFFTKGVGGR